MKVERSDLEDSGEGGVEDPDDGKNGLRGSASGTFLLGQRSSSSHLLPLLPPA